MDYVSELLQDYPPTMSARLLAFLLTYVMDPVAVALRHTPEDEKDNVVYEPKNPNHRSFSIEHFAGDVRLYAGLISTLQAKMQQATGRMDADEYDKMICMLIGRTTSG